MEYRENGSKYKNYCEWEFTKQTPYNYGKYCILQHNLSNKIFSSKNETLQSLLSFYEQSIIFLLKYIDRLKHFKNYHWKNR